MTITLLIDGTYPGQAAMARRTATITAMTATAGASLADYTVLAGSTTVQLDADGHGTAVLDPESVGAEAIIYRVTVGRTVRHLDLTLAGAASSVSWGDPVVLVMAGPAPSGWVPIAGPGVPAGGTTGQVLGKASNANYDTAWVPQSGAVDSVNGQTGAVVLTSRSIDAVPISAVGLLPNEVNRGAWDVATAYVADDVVSSAGAVFVALGVTTGDDPTSSPLAWALVGARSVEIGPGSSAGDYAASVGYGGSAAGVSAVNIGTDGSASGPYSINIGPFSSAAGEGAISIGVAANAPNDGDVNIGHIYLGHVVDPTGDAGGPTPDGATITTGFVDLPETAVVTNPAADHQRLIARTDGLYVRDETGAEVGPLAAATDITGKEDIGVAADLVADLPEMANGVGTTVNLATPGFMSIDRALISAAQVGTLASTTADTTIMSPVLPASSNVDKRWIRFVASGTFTNNSGSASDITIRLKHAGGTAASVKWSAVPSNANARVWTIRGELQVTRFSDPFTLLAGVLSAGMSGAPADSSADLGDRYGASQAVFFTVGIAVTLNLSAQMSVSNANTKVEGGICAIEVLG